MPVNENDGFIYDNIDDYEMEYIEEQSQPKI